MIVIKGSRKSSSHLQSRGSGPNNKIGIGGWLDNHSLANIGVFDRCNR